MKNDMDLSNYMEDERGAMWPVAKVAEIDRTRDELVRDLAARWREMSTVLAELKKHAMSEVQNFVALSAMEYGVEVGGRQGNVQLVSFNGKYKVQVQIHKYIAFDERLHVAKSLIDECINDWASGANDNIRVLINDAFDTDNKGNVSTSKILGLRRIKIDDSRWQSAMQALADCMTVSGSKSYVRVYQRVGDDNRWVAIPLDMAVL